MGENRVVVELFFEKPSFEEVSKIAKSLEEAGVKSMMLPPEERHINTHLIVELADMEKARAKIKEMGVPVKEKEVMLIKMDNKPGAMADTIMRISGKGINLTYAFSVTVSPTTSYLLLNSADNEQALKLLES